MYFPWSSAHPISVKKASVKAGGTCFKLICSEESDFYNAEHFFMAKLLRRGYPKKEPLHWFSQPLHQVQKEVKKRSASYTTIISLSSMGIHKCTKIRQYFLQKAEERGISLPDSVTDGLLLSLKRTRNFYDLFCQTNLTILEQEGSLSR